MYLEIPDIRKNIEDFKARFEPELKDTDIEVYLFPQCWGNTAMGFTDRIGCDVITVGYTTVILGPNKFIAGVYFGEELAYIVNSANNKLFSDIANKSILPKGEEYQYETEYTNKQILKNTEDIFLK